MKKNKHTNFIASDVEVLILSRDPLTNGICIPPEAYLIYPSKIRVLYGADGDERIAGIATLRREGDRLYADFILKSVMKDISKAAELLSKLYPAIGYDALEYHNDIILKLKITDLYLTENINYDLNIKPLGSRLAIMPEKERLH